MTKARSERALFCTLEPSQQRQGMHGVRIRTMDDKVVMIVKDLTVDFACMEAECPVFFEDRTSMLESFSEKPIVD